MNKPVVGTTGFYWTRSVTYPDEDLEIRLWTGYSWLTCGVEEHFPPEAFVAVSDQLEWNDE